MKGMALLASGLALLLAAPATAHTMPAAAQTTSDDGWKVTFAPYLMGAGMSGTTGIAGQEVTVDVSASDIFSHLQFGAMGVVAARKGKWGVLGDFIWMALGATSDQPPANIDPNQGAFSFYGARRLSPVAEVTFGMRWNVLQGKISFKGPAGTVLEKTKQWVDPIVGLNLRSNGREPHPRRAVHRHRRIRGRLEVRVAAIPYRRHRRQQACVGRVRLSLARHGLRVGRGDHPVQITTC